MTVHKIAISLPDRALARAKRAVASGKARSVSAFIADAIERTADADDLERMLGEMLTETGGPPTLAERRTFRATFGAAPRPAKRKRAR